jgi:S1-C subfamily serine protease
MSEPNGTYGAYGAQGGSGGYAGSGGSAGPGGSGGYAGHGGFGTYPSYPPPPPPPARHHRRGLIITGTAALGIGALAGALINGVGFGSSGSGSATATSATSLTSAEIAQRVDPALVDIVSTDSLAGEKAAGTGIVLTSTGEILTNNHVIEGATSISVTDVGNGKTYTAKVVGYDSSSDVAVIQLEGASGLTTASLGNSSSVQVGDTITALGNAEGKGGTPSVATGTVTNLDQSITASDESSSSSEQLTGLIESNAPIEPGDSGGSLVNSHGQVVGMDTAASSSYQFSGPSGSSGSSGSGSASQTQAFSIPINTAIAIAQQIESGKGSSTVHVGATAFLGIGLSGSSSSGSSSGFSQGGFGSGGTAESGAYLEYVEQGSPAAEVGLAAGDTITSLGGQQVTSGTDVKNILVTYHPGDKIQVGWTDASGQTHTGTLTLTTGPAA